MDRRAWGSRLVAALLLVGLAYGLYQGRRAFIRAFFGDGSVTVAGGPRGPRSDGGLGPAPRVRVVLIDGLGRSRALGRPAFDRLCAAGRELRVDVGFPTVSLPVQHVLWTGRTQQESGVLYRIPALAEPPVDALPAFVESRAIAESHPAIVHSFGFAAAEPPLAVGDALPEGWRAGFDEAAIAAVAEPTRLVFVHVLRVDEAGHAEGADAAAYEDAAAAADALLGRLWAADPGARWLVLADHGHRPGGGHGGPELAIRQVRACLQGPGIDASAAVIDARLVDLSRALADSLGIGPSPGSAGLPWSTVIAGDAPPAELPRPSAGRWVVALLGALALVAAGLVSAGRGLRWGPLVWPLLAHGGLIAFVGPLTLSNPAVYPPLGAALIAAAAPGWVALVVTLIVVLRRSRTLVALVSPLFGGLAPVFFCGVLAGVGGGEPPLIPIWSAECSAWMALAWVAALVTAMVTAMAAVIAAAAPTSPRDPASGASRAR
ncbi:MAG: alkaline phosphatase family protein [Myxococcales bacterium]|nr:alkaline phosphatase family protein [Myxococcales bacterium]